MPVSLQNVKFYKTTGGLGGAITATELLSQVATLSSAISGVAVIDAADNALGTGTLRYSAAAVAFYYTPPGGTEGSGIVVTGTGEIAVRGAGTNAGYIRLSITFGSLPVSNATRTVTIANDMNELFDDVTKSDALNGAVEYRCVYIKNTHGTDAMQGAALWIQADSVGADTIAIGLDPAGVGASATTIANETVSPSGVAFSTPMSEAAALTFAAMTAGQSAAFWVRRTVSALTTTVVADNYSWLRFRFLT